MHFDENYRVESVKIRTAAELSLDLCEGMSEQDVPQNNEVVRFYPYAFFETNGRWCVAQINDSKIVKVDYYESYNGISDIVYSRQDISYYVKKLGIPNVITVNGEELLLFKKNDGSNIALRLSEDGGEVAKVIENVDLGQ